MKASIEAEIGREVVAKWRWFNQVGSGREGESKVFNP
jgi:hypothetical protein